MRIAIFSDIHGNPFAVRAVLEDISTYGLFDAIVMAGDVCSGGSDPAACVDMLLAAGVQAVYGNADEFIFKEFTQPPDEMFRARWELTVLESRWAEEKIGEERTAWLRGLPFSLRFCPTGNSRNDLLVVHANPKNVYGHIAPPEEIQIGLTGKVFQPDKDPALAGFFEEIQAEVIAFGHFHYTSERYLFGTRLVNVSPCSYSAFDSDRRARYTIFSWDGGWQIERKFVDYDYRQEGLALLASDMPSRELMAKFFN